MSRRAVGIVALLWVLLLLVVGTIVEAQVYQVNPIPPRVIAGPEFGIDGAWVPVKIGTADGRTQPLR